MFGEAVHYHKTSQRADGSRWEIAGTTESPSTVLLDQHKVLLGLLSNSFMG